MIREITCDSIQPGVNERQICRKLIESCSNPLNQQIKNVITDGLVKNMQFRFFDFEVIFISITTFARRYDCNL